SFPVASTAVALMVFMIIIFLFPVHNLPSAQTMNCAVVVGDGIFALSLAYYFFPIHGGRRWFTGPIRNIDAVHDVDGSSDLEEKVRNEGSGSA
ncbi:hypothetical protein BDQ12DRAFT_609451, partial [Crucibulum laeve]